MSRTTSGVRPNAFGMFGADDGVYLASFEQIAQRLAAGVRLDVDRLEHRHDGGIAVEAGLVDGALDPFDLIEIDAEVVLHQAADEDRGGLSVERHADALAGEILC